jgi:membrane associated rhomboid family serine protease
VRRGAERQLGLMAMVSLLLSLSIFLTSPQWGLAVAALLGALLLAAYLALRRWGEAP